MIEMPNIGCKTGSIPNKGKGCRYKVLPAASMTHQAFKATNSHPLQLNAFKATNSHPLQLNAGGATSCTKGNQALERTSSH